MAFDEGLAERIREFLHGPAVQERRMFGGLAFLVGGKVCCGVMGTDLMVRVPKAEHEAVLRQLHVRPMDFTGRSLKGFVYVSAAGTTSAPALRQWIALGQRVATEAAAGIAKPARRPARRT